MAARSSREPNVVEEAKEKLGLTVEPNTTRQVIASVEQALRREPRLGANFALDRIAIEGDDTLVLEGNVSHLAQKKLALLRAAAVPRVRGIVDRVHVVPRAPASDRHIRAQLRDMFAQDANFSNIELRENVAASPLAAQFKAVAGFAQNSIGRVDINVHEGIVILDGVVPSLVCKRLAGAMAWWVPAVRDVVNGIAVDPPEEDGPDQIEEAVRIVLDRHFSAGASQIRVGVRGRLVRLTGLVRSETMRAAAESDAWSVFGVDNVEDEIVVGP